MILNGGSITGNTATDDGGGIYNLAGIVDGNLSLVTDNTPSDIF